MQYTSNYTDFAMRVKAITGNAFTFVQLTQPEKSNLFYAKSRVAPLKTVSMPRLELCGAQLIALIASQIQKLINIHFDEIEKTRLPRYIPSEL